MADAIRLEGVERSPDGNRPCHLACVRHGAEALGLRQRERVGVRLGRVLGLEPAETDADDSALAVGGGVPDDLLASLPGAPR